MFLRLRPGSLASGSLTYLLSNLLSAAVPFILIPILTRYLSPAEYGQVGIFQGLVTGLAAIIGLNATGAAARKLYDDDLSPQDLSHFIGACLQILLASATVLFILSLFFHADAAGWLGLESAWLLWSVPVSAAGFVINLRLSQWQIRRQALQYGALQVTQSLLLLLLALLLVVGMGQGAAGRIEAQVAAVAACALLALHFLRRDDLLGWAWRPVYIREALAYGVPLVPHIAGIFLLGMADRFFINSELGPAQAGIYLVAVQLSSIMAIVFDAINKAYIPWLFERLKRDNVAEKRQTVQLTYLYFALALATAGLFFLAGPAVIRLLAGEQYGAAASVLGWLALGQAFGGGYFMVTNYILYSKKTAMMSLATVSCGALNIGLLLVLVPAWGLQGAAAAYTVAMACRFFWMWWLAQRRHPMPWGLGRTAA
ncbi:MAG: exopolysaccharide biosynthesis protein [Moraxellaceae bacterium]|nr:exopolysaccharide biosynthesis protein [Moraxellaceae bacterium]